MAFAQGSRSGLSIQAETTFGVAPGSPQLVQIPYNTHSLSLSKDRVQGNDILPDRMNRVDRHGNRKAGGDIVVDLRKGDYDALLESAFMSSFTTATTLATTAATSAAGTATITFAVQGTAPFPVGSKIIVAGVTPSGFNGTFTVTACTTSTVQFANSTTGPQTVAGTVGLANTLKVGTTLKSFYIEDAATDITQFRLFSGMSVSSLAVSIKTNQMVSGTFSMVGKDMTISGTSFDSAKDAISGNAPFDAYSGTMKIADAGGSLTAIATITGIDFTFNNNFAPTFVVGSASTPQLEYGKATVEGTITAYFEDATLINRFINETATKFEVAINDPTGTNPYTWLFPNVKINGADVPVGGPTSRVISLPFVALYDTTENTNIKLTRTS
jgi:Phage tail tube protein